MVVTTFITYHFVSMPVSWMEGTFKNKIYIFVCINITILSLNTMVKLKQVRKK